MDENIFIRRSGDLTNYMTVEPFLPLNLKAEAKIKAVKTVSLRDIIFDISGGATPKAKGDSYLEEFDEGSIPFLRIQNIGANELILLGLNFINSDTHYNYLKRSILNSGDVLVTITGRVGTSCVVPPNFKANINQHIVRMSILPSYLPEFVSIFLNTSLGKTITNRFVTGGTRIALDYHSLLDIQIPVHSIEKQKQIVKFNNKKQSDIEILLEKILEIKEYTSSKVQDMLL